MQLRETDDFIRLGQAMKKAGMTLSGAEAKILIEEEKVTVNGETELRRGRKLYPQDVFAYDNRQVQIVR